MPELSVLLPFAAPFVMALARWLVIRLVARVSRAGQALKHPLIKIRIEVRRDD